MRRPLTTFTWLLILLALSAAAQEQRLLLPDSDMRLQDAVPHSGPSVDGSARTPHLIKFTGAFKDYMGRPMTGVHGVTFALYRQHEGGSPIWMESTSVEFDDQGRFTAMLGGTSEPGLTPELFTTGDPRWLGVQLQLPGYEEQPRTLLVTVPYAIKALDADTLGGLPVSAFVRSDSSALAQRPEGPMATIGGGFPAPLYVTGSGTAGRIAKWTTGDDLGNSSILLEAPGTLMVGENAAPASLTINRLLNLTQGNGSDQVSLNWLTKDDNSNGGFEATDKGWHFTGRSNTWGTSPEQNDLILFKFDAGAWTGVLTMDFPTGNVGIGATQPTAKLDVGGGFSVAAFRGNSTDAVVTLQNTGPGGNSWDIASTANGSSAGAGRFVIARTGVAHHLTIIDNGNVGIGTTNPAQKMDINGFLKISGPMTNGIVFADGTVQTTAAGSLAFGNATTLAASEESGKNAYAALLGEVERLRAEVDQLRAMLEQLRSVSTR